MIILDNLGKHRKGKLWINEFPEIHHINFETLTAQVNTSIDHQTPPCTVTLELSLPLDTSYYALLGASYIPTTEDTLEIIVQVCPDIDDTNRVIQSGIPRFYATKVLNSAQTYIETNGFPAGKLEFVCSAQDIVGSSPWIFSKVTEIIIKIIDQSPNNIDKNEIELLIKESLHQN